MEDQKNFILAMVLSMLVLIGYYQFFGKPMAEEARRQAEFEQEMAEEALATPVQPAAVETIAESLRIPVRTPAMEGSFQLRGFRFDDLKLLDYDATLEDGSPNVALLVPEGGDFASYVTDNWVPVDGGSGLRNEWQLVSGETVTPDSAVVVRLEGEGFRVDRTVSVADRYLLEVSDVVTNTSGESINLERKGAARQHGLPDGLINFMLLQEGPIAVVDGRLTDMKYGKLAKERQMVETGAPGWAGLTDKYWLQAAVAPREAPMTAEFQYSFINNEDVYEAGYTTQPLTLTAGASVTSVGHLFTGAKERALLERLEDEYAIDELNRAIDWGTLRILVKPMTTVLNWLGGVIGNFGLAIMALTLLIKVVLFPVFNKQYTSMAKMRKVAPELTRLRERYSAPEDRMQLQQEMMALYKKEGVNPLSGCLPIIPTIFVFFALYKTILIDVELRHAPFFGWIRDLSAQDPLSVLNGFGLLPWGPEPLGLAFLAIGPLALMYGASFALMQTLQTPGGDPMQRKIFAFLPWVFMFIIAPFAAGLLVYWVWNNILGFLQSYYINKKYGTEIPLETFFAKLFGRAKTVGGEGVEVLPPEKK